MTSGLLHSEELSAREVLVRFCDLDVQGGQLTPEGWQKTAALFAEPGKRQRYGITVIRDYVVSRPLIENQAEFYVEYIELGRIDLSKIRFSSPLPAGIKVRAGFQLKQSGTTPVGHRADRAEWKIEGRVPEPHLTVDSAIRYVTELRTDAKDPAARKNADRTLAALKRLR